MTTARKPLMAGERVLLIDSRERRYLVTLRSGKQFHSHMGIVEHDAIIGGDEGSYVRTTKGGRLIVFRPSLSDYQLKMKRGAQVIYPKDVGQILVGADIFPGAFVVEAGTGSGALTLALARAVGENGRVVSYELREDHHVQALENIDAWYEGLGGKPENLELKVGDIFGGIEEDGVDRMVLDLPEPWAAIPATTDSMLPGGILCCYLPTIPQVSQTVETMRGNGFDFIETLEVLLRTWNIEGQSVRPDHRMVGHTGFLITGRKLAEPGTDEA